MVREQAGPRSQGANDARVRLCFDTSRTWRCWISRLERSPSAPENTTRPPRSSTSASSKLCGKTELEDSCAKQRNRRTSLPCSQYLLQHQRLVEGLRQVQKVKFLPPHIDNMLHVGRVCDCVLLEGAPAPAPRPSRDTFRLNSSNISGVEFSCTPKLRQAK